ncbi:MAG: glycoside hydrolase family 65 protein [Oscillospiraceae bacterium]|nr:glycoside hydrolase family 65 protein [Oscillospiraceae bacterium]
MPSYKNVFDGLIDSAISYDTVNAREVYETVFHKDYQGKCEAVLSLGNGYMGVRSSLEENYTGQTRGLFVAGTFNRFDEAEVSELPNAADMIAMDIRLRGEEFNLEKGETSYYQRSLDLITGTLNRDVTWKSLKGITTKFNFSRFVSMAELHTIGQKVAITPDTDTEILFRTGIDGTMTNTGTQHFSEGEKRFYEKKYMQYVQTTGQSKINFVLTCGINVTLNGKPVEAEPFIAMDRRKLFSVYTIPVKKGETLEVTKISYVTTSHDLEYMDKDVKEIQELSLGKLKEQYAKGFEALHSESIKKWDELVWGNIPVTIESEDNFYQLAMRFAQYHLQIMTPAHDARMSIAAKGLSGEGYKGHTFWDNEIFTLPYFIFTQPEVARSLCKYRFLSLPGAHQKAKTNGYKGAMYPWESAGLSDGEVTPVWGAADIVTGERIKIWSGFIQQHISSDVVFGIWQYYMVTGDKEFMSKYGYEIIFDTASFWISRLEYDESDSLYHINGVMGPDEYKEHVDDNAFTNYMAHWNISKAIEFYNILKEEDSEIFKRLNYKLDLIGQYEKFTEVIDKIYLPQPRKEDLVLAQAKNYLELKDIDLTKYKNQTHVGELFRDFNLVQVNQMQVLKQADVLILFLLLENLFSPEVKKANWDYYEPRTLHDSSLSLSTHVVLAADMGNQSLAMELFKRCIKIDLGENMKTSDAGIHTASIGGIWQSVVLGFGGVRMVGGKLRISPLLPEAWKKLSFFIYWKGQKLSVEIMKNELFIKNLTGNEPVTVEIHGDEVTFDDQLRKNL